MLKRNAAKKVELAAIHICTLSAGYEVDTQAFLEECSRISSVIYQLLEPERSEYQIDFLRKNSRLGGEIETLLDLQSRYYALNQQWHDDVWRLNQRHHARCQKLYRDRQAVIGGTKKGAAMSLASGIPRFWLRAMKNNPIVSQRIRHRDEPILSYLSDVRVEFMDKGVTGFKILFDFDDNPFFSNPTLVKEFIYERSLLEKNIYGQWPYKRADGCAISWKATQNRTASPAGKMRNRSFFHFFESPSDGEQKREYVDSDDGDGGDKYDQNYSDEDYSDEDYTDEDYVQNYDDEDTNENESSEDDTISVDQQETQSDQDDGVDDDLDDGIDRALDHDFELGEEIKDGLVPYAIHWFTGEALLF